MVGFNLQEHYQTLLKSGSGVMDTIFSSSEDVAAVTKSHNYISDFELLQAAVKNRPESHLIGLAIVEYQYALVALCTGATRHAFSSLRLAMELALSSIQFSAYQIRYYRWSTGQQDINWGGIIDESDGLFSKQFISPFFPDLSGSGKQFGAIAGKTYRECSEYVHGNLKTHSDDANEIKFRKEEFDLWHELAESVRLCVTFAFAGRFSALLTTEELQLVQPVLTDALGQRVAQQEMLESFEEDRVFPVYVSFVRSSLVHTDAPDQFQRWMLAKICSAIVRSLAKAGVISTTPKSAAILVGTPDATAESPTQVEKIIEAYESSWKSPNAIVDAASLPSIDEMKEAIEDLSDQLDIKRFVLLIDEAAHIFLPEQQRQFFTLFRDLRSHCITCNAAVYPGVTSFGDTFQPAHDATMLTIDRDIQAAGYIDNMREIVEKQAESTVLRFIAQNGRNFAILAYAASGNPRILLKTLAAAPRVNSTEITNVIRDYYRTDIWAEHSTLSEKYVGHRVLIDWGRQFIETSVLPDIKSKNDQYIASDKATSAYFWLHRDSPAVVKEALRVLAYTGIVNEQASGIKASRGEIGTRYMVNLGCLFALEGTPTANAFEIATELTPKRMTEFGANHGAYKRLVEHVSGIATRDAPFSLETQMAKPIDVLDLTPWQKEKISGLGLVTVGQVFGATEEKLKEASYVGDKRARRIRNAAVAAVLEYLSG